MFLVLFLLPLLLLFILAFKHTQRKRASHRITLAEDNNLRHIELQDLTAKFGTFFALTGQNGGNEFVTSDPAVADEVFSKKFFAFGDRKGFHSHAGHVFVASGGHWKELRKRVSFVNAKSRLKPLEPLLRDSVGPMLGKMETNVGKVFDFHITSLHMTAGVLARMAFCTAQPCRLLDQFCETYTDFAEQLLLAKELARLSPQRNTCALPRAIEDGAREKQMNVDLFMELYKHIKEMEKQKQNEDCDKVDVDDLDQMAQSIGTLFLENAMKSVGIDTIGHCLALLVHFLAQHPDVQQELRDELLKGDDDPPLLMATVKETLRLCPIVSFANTRDCTSPVTLSNGAKVNIGDSVVVDVFSMGQNRAFWGEDAHKFSPQRWLAEEPCDNLRRHWLAFGLGPRSCVGKQMAEDLLKIAITTIFYRFRISSEEEKFSFRLSAFIWSVPMCCGRRKC
uniref:Cytochrome P450 n=1 Tax=Globodera rostochiensis TaxID=31243 RepID=A0A914HJA4_GLORO